MTPPFALCATAMCRLRGCGGGGGKAVAMLPLQEAQFVRCLRELFPWPTVRANKTITGCKTGVAEGLHNKETTQQRKCKIYLAASHLATKRIWHKDRKNRKGSYPPSKDKHHGILQCYMWHRILTLSPALPSNIQSRLCIRCDLHAGAKEEEKRNMRPLIEANNLNSSLLWFVVINNRNIPISATSGLGQPYAAKTHRCNHREAPSNASTLNSPARKHTRHTAPNLK